MSPPSHIRRESLTGMPFSDILGIHSHTALFASSLDFILVFRMTGLIWDNLFGYFALHECLTLQGAGSFGIIGIGIVAICNGQMHF
jgi:hypothetical protein